MSDLKRAAHLMWAHYDAVKDSEREEELVQAIADGIRGMHLRGKWQSVTVARRALSTLIEHLDEGR